MNILQLISSEGYYGAESMLLALARTLPALGCGSVVGVFRDGRSHRGELETRAAQLGLRVESVFCAGRWDWKTVGRIRNLVDAHGVDVLHTHGYKADIYGGAAAWPGRVALVATCHNWPSRLPGMRAYAALDRLALRRFDRVATASGPVAEILRRWKVPAHKLKTIPNGVDMEPFLEPAPSLRKELGAGSGRLVGFVGRLVPDKGGAVLLAAAQAVLAVFPNAKFVFAGQGPARAAWQALAQKLGIASQVVFAGSRDDMPAVYASLDMVVLPSFKEAMPMCLLEALAAARPVVATAVGAVPKVIVPGVTGLLCEPGDADALSTAILRLLRDPELGRALGNHGRAHVARHFAAKAVGRSYVGLYREALHDHRRQTGVPAVWQRSRL
ncbi:MAG: glycosyltransferase family 4 protein [Bryobacteraceae bacterium]